MLKDYPKGFQGVSLRDTKGFPKEALRHSPEGFPLGAPLRYPKGRDSKGLLKGFSKGFHRILEGFQRIPKGF